MSRLKRLKQPSGVGAQLRMLPAAEMPPSAASVRGPLERDLVDDIRAALGRLGHKTWSGRVAIFSCEACGARPSVPFIPALGTGCPDILGVTSGRAGRLFAIECKRDASEKERASQRAWREEAAYWGIACAVIRSVSEAVEFVQSLLTSCNEDLK